MKKPKDSFCCVCGKSMKDNEGFPSPLDSGILRLCECCYRGRSLVPLDAKPTVIFQSLNDYYRFSIVKRLLEELVQDHHLHLTSDFLEELHALSGDIYCDVYGDDL